MKECKDCKYEDELFVPCPDCSTSHSKFEPKEGITVGAPDKTTNSHYKDCFKDCNDVDDYCMKTNTNFFIGNILKAAVRLDKKYDGKDAIQDLNKIIHYAKQEIERREN